MQVYPSTDSLIMEIIKLLTLQCRLTSREIDQKIINQIDIADELKTKLHDPENSKRTELAYMLAWARTKAKRKNLIYKDHEKKWHLKE